jgi:exonuclease III
MEVLNFLTWNLDNNASKSFYEDLNIQIAKDDIHILVFQEFLNNKYISEIKDFEEIGYFLNGKGRRWVRIFLKKKSGFDYEAATSYASNKLRCVVIKVNNGFRFNLMGVHLYSEARKSKRYQLFQNREIPKYIQEYQINQKNDNTLVVGDLNYKPFDIELSEPDFLNTNNNKDIIRLFKQRDVDGKKFPFFYNPMWNIIGDHDYVAHETKVSGTYYWYPNDIAKYHWNLIDGVLGSSSIMDRILVESIRIQTTLNGKPLVKSSIQRYDESLLEKGYSDHLPISFKLNIK